MIVDGHSEHSRIVLPPETGEQPSLSLLRVKSIIERALAYLQAPWVTL